MLSLELLDFLVLFRIFSSMKCIIGLGNPGKEYANTRHNVGFFMVDQFREKFHFGDWSDSRFKGVVSE